MDDEVHLSAQDACRLLSALCLLPPGELSIARLGLSLVKLRGAGAGSSPSARRPARRAASSSQRGGSDGGGGLSPAQLFACGVAATALGEEGWEMAAEVLPGATLAAAERCIREHLAGPYEGVDPGWACRRVAQRHALGHQHARRLRCCRPDAPAGTRTRTRAYAPLAVCACICCPCGDQWRTDVHLCFDVLH